MSTAGKVSWILGGLLVLILAVVFLAPVLFTGSDLWDVAEAELSYDWQDMPINAVCTQLGQDLGITVVHEGEVAPVTLTGTMQVATWLQWLAALTGSEVIVTGTGVRLVENPGWFDRLGGRSHPDAGYWVRWQRWWGFTSDEKVLGGPRDAVHMIVP